MLPTPLTKNPCILEYIKAQRDLFELTLIDNCEAHISYAYEIDYHNFMVLATQIARGFANREQHNAIRTDISIFMDILNENIIDPAIRRFHKRMVEEETNGELYDLFVASKQHALTLHDFLQFAKKSIRYFENKLLFYGGKKSFKVFNEYLDKSAKEQTITIENDITSDRWTMYFYYENNRESFFKAESNEYLFHSILTPIIKDFYNHFRD